MVDLIYAYFDVIFDKYLIKEITSHPITIRCIYYNLNNVGSKTLGPTPQHTPLGAIPQHPPLGPTPQHSPLGAIPQHPPLGATPQHPPLGSSQVNCSKTLRMRQRWGGLLPPFVPPWG